MLRTVAMSRNCNVEVHNNIQQMLLPIIKTVEINSPPRPKWIPYQKSTTSNIVQSKFGWHKKRSPKHPKCSQTTTSNGKPRKNHTTHSTQHKHKPLTFINRTYVMGAVKLVTNMLLTLKKPLSLTLSATNTCQTQHWQCPTDNHSVTQWNLINFLFSHLETFCNEPASMVTDWRLAVGKSVKLVWKSSLWQSIRQISKLLHISPKPLARLSKPSEMNENLEKPVNSP